MQLIQNAQANVTIQEKLYRLPSGDYIFLNQLRGIRLSNQESKHLIFIDLFDDRYISISYGTREEAQKLADKIAEDYNANIFTILPGPIKTNIDPQFLIQQC